MYSLWRLLAVFLIQIGSSRTQRRGEPCVVNDGPGVCKTLDDCPFADNLVRELKKPKHCSFLSNEEIVCCPLEDIPAYALGKFGRFFEGTKNGKLVSEKTTCYYEGKLPMRCCRNAPDPPPPPEIGCEPLYARNTNSIVVDKCRELERWVRPCVGNGRREDTCAQDELTQRLSNADKALPREFPHMALLGYRAAGRTEWLAGGSLVSERWILTAAHVVTHQQWGDIQFARLGILLRSDASTRSLYYVVRRIPHPEYKFQLKYHDIALLQLDRRVEFSPDVRPACLPMSPDFSTLLVSGWGSIGPGKSNLSDSLLKITIQALPASSCGSIVDSKALPGGWRDDLMICAGGDDRSDSCEGDSGGPLQTYSDSSSAHCQYHIVGVVSWGPQCGKGRPGAYTRVQNYVDWIVKNVWPQT